MYSNKEVIEEIAFFQQIETQILNKILEFT